MRYIILFVVAIVISSIGTLTWATCGNGIAGETNYPNGQAVTEECDNGIFNGYNIPIDGVRCTQSCQICGDGYKVDGICINEMAVCNTPANDPNYAQYDWSYFTPSGCN